MLLIMHWLLYIDYLWLYTYLHLQFWHSYRSRIHKQPPEVFLNILQISQKSLCVGVSFLESCKPSGLQHYLKDTPAQVFSCEIWEILNNTILKNIWTTASVYWLLHFARSNRVSQIPAILLRNKARQSKMKTRFSYDG